jgi:magnesium transporter
MIKIFKKTEQGLQVIPELVAGSWLHVCDPDAGEQRLLRDTIGIPEGFIASALDIDERARTDREDGATLITLRVPYASSEKMDVPYQTTTLGIVLVKEYLVTICKSDTPLVSTLVESRGRLLSTGKRNQLILYLLSSTAQTYLAYLRRMDAAIEAAEDKLHRSLRNEEVLTLLNYQKSLTYFTTGLKSNDLMMQRLQKSKLFDMYPDDQDLLDDVLTENSQAIEMTSISSNILSQMMDAFASIISNNLNIVMKFLASVTILLSLPTLVASVYGMNLDLPFQDGGLAAFYLVMGLSVLLSASVAYIFWRRNWL